MYTFVCLYKKEKNDDESGVYKSLVIPVAEQQQEVMESRINHNGNKEVKAHGRAFITKMWGCGRKDGCWCQPELCPGGQWLKSRGVAARQHLLSWECVTGRSKIARPQVVGKGAEKCHRKVTESFLPGHIPKLLSVSETLKMRPERQDKQLRPPPNTPCPPN